MMGYGGEAGNLEIEAISQVYGMTIFVFLEGEADPLLIMEKEFYPKSTPCVLECCSGCHYNALNSSLIHIPSSETVSTCTNINKCSNYGSVVSDFQIMQTFGWFT